MGRNVLVSIFATATESPRGNYLQFILVGLGVVSGSRTGLREDYAGATRGMLDQTVLIPPNSTFRQRRRDRE